MAETVRGLTIRIGGDLSDFNAAIKTAKSAASTLQTQLRQVDKALKFDASNVENATTKVELLKDRAQALASKLDSTKTYMEKLGETATDLDGKKISDIASKTDNAALAARQATENYADVTAELAELYNEADKTVQGLGKIDGEFESFRDAKNSEGILKAVEGLRDLGSSSEESAAEVDALATKITDVYRNWEQANLENGVYASVAQFEDLNVQAALTEAEIRNITSQLAEMRNVDVDGPLADAAESAKEAERYLEEAGAAAEQCGTGSREFKDAQSQAKSAVEKTKAALDDIPSTVKEIAEKTGDMAEYVGSARDEWIDVNTRLTTTKGTLENLKKEQQRLQSEIETAEKAYREFSEQAESASDGIKDAKSAQEKLKEEIEESKDRYLKLAEEVEKTSIEVEELDAAAKEANEALSTAEAAQEYDELSSKVKTLESEIDSTCSSGKEHYRSLGDGIRDVGQALQELSSVASKVLSEMVDSADEVSGAYYDMRKTVDGTDTEFENLYEAALGYSSTSVTSADELLEIMAMGGQLGIATEELEEFAEVVSNISVASDVDADTAAEDLGQLAAILDDLNSDTFGSFSDSLVRLGNNTATTESSILDITTRIGSMGSIVGLTTPQMLALSATVASTGMNSEAAGTAISNTLSDIETAVAEGGESLEQFASISGMSSSEFADTWENEPIAAIQAFVQGLNDLEADGGSADAALEELGITGTRQKQAIEGLMQTIDDLDDNLEMSTDAWDGVSDEWGEAGDAANEAEKKSEGFSGELSQLKNNLQNIAAVFGDSLTPHIAKAADILADVTDAVLDMTDSTKTGIVVLTGVTAAVGPATVSIGNFVEGIGNIKKSLEKTQSKFKVMQRLINGLSSKLTPLNVSLLGIATTLASIIALAIWDYIEKEKEYTEECESAWRDYDSILQDAYDSAYAMTDGLEDTAETAEDVADDVHDVTESLAEFKDEISETFTDLYEDEAALDNAMAIIEEYGGAESLTATQTGELSAALDIVNETLDTNYTLHDSNSGAIEDENGEIEDNIDLIRDQIEAYKDEAESAALQETLNQAASELQAAEDAYWEAVESGTEEELVEAKTNLAEYTEIYRDTAAEIGGLAAGLSDSTIKAATSVDDAWSESFVDIEAAFKSTMGDDFTSEFESTLTDALTSAITTGDWEQVYGLAEQYGIDLESYILSAFANGGTAGDTIDAYYAEIALGLEDGNQDAVLAVQDGLSSISAAMTEEIDNGTIEVGDAVDAMSDALSGDYDGVISLLASKSIELPDEIVNGISEGTIEVGDAAIEMVGSMILTSDDEEYAEALASAFGLSSDYVQQMRDGFDTLDQSEMETRLLEIYGDISDNVAANTEGINYDNALLAANAYYDGLTSDDAVAQYKQGYEDLVAAATVADDSVSGTLYDNFLASVQKSVGDLSAEELKEAGVYSNLFSDLVEIQSIDEAEAEMYDEMTDIVVGAAENAGEILITGASETYAHGASGYINSSLEDSLDGIDETIDKSDMSGLWEDKLDELESVSLESSSDLTTLWEDEFDALNELALDSGGDFVLNVSDGMTSDEAFSLLREAAADDTDRVALYWQLAHGGSSRSGLLGPSSQGGFLWGQHLALNYADGVGSDYSLSYAINRATLLTDALASVLQNSVPKKGPFSGAEKGGERSGRHLVENIAAGLLDGIPTVVSAAEEVSDALKEAIEGAAIEAAVAATVETAVSSTNAEVDYSESKLDRLEALLASLDGTARGASETATTTTINQTFETKVVRADADLYTAAPIIYRSALNEAQAAMI